MLKISDNAITLTKGDSMTLAVSLMNKDKKVPYVPVAGDTVRFAVSIGYKGEADYELIFTTPIPNDTLLFTVSATETEALEYRTYNYDVEITHENGLVDTFISSTLTITGEVL